MSMEYIRCLIGSKARDKVTGFTGQIVSYLISGFGNDLVSLEGCDTTGRPIQEWYDIDRIERMEG